MIGYCGTGYNGMQIQNNPDVKTIENDIFQAFIKAGAVSPENSLDLKKNGFMRAARTDKGVHAAGNVISCKLIIEDEDILEKINANLPSQIRVWGIERTNKSFDCRKMCSSRVYEYLLPTYSLLPAKPNSILANFIAENKKAHPGVSRDDEEGDKWWEETLQTIMKEGNISQEDIFLIQTKVNDTSNPANSNNNEDAEVENVQINPIVNENGELTELGKQMRLIKDTENNCRRSYRISKERLDLFRQAMKQYEGTNNFHNFTLGKHYKDASAKRFMKDTSVSEPFIIEGTEWVSIKIHGQSFMLHQIRKMISMACLIVRTGCPIQRIVDCFGPTKINIPKAPALGLLLENPVYEGYNGILEKHGYKPIEFTKYEAEMNEFKMKFIYDKIYGEETKENTFHGFFNFIDTFKGNETQSNKDKHIFDFLGAVFENGLEKKN